MSIVLPRRKKRVDLFSPTKSIRKAKERLGPIYFDETLLESHNAVELAKLVSKWDEIDKKKIKRVRELCREQGRMIRSLKHHSQRLEDEEPSSIEGVETIEGKMVPPGFRFRHNGELKGSTTSLATLYADLEGDSLATRLESQQSVTGSKSKSTTRSLDESGEHAEEVDYDKEIRELEAVLYDIYKGLLKSRIELFNTSGRKIRTYLRGHKNEYIPPPETLDYDDFENPNDRFAFKPGGSASEHLYKKKISNPSHRSCVGCQFRLKAASDTVAIKAAARKREEVGRRRWNYVPRGKYVGSTTALSTISLLSRPSKAKIVSNVRFHEANAAIRTRSEKILKTFKNEIGIPLRHTVSSPAQLRGRRSKSAATEKELVYGSTARSPISSAEVAQSGMSVSGKESSVLWRSYSGLSRTDSNLFYGHRVDHRLRMKTLKNFQEEEEKRCREKVKNFLDKLDSSSSVH